MKYALTTLKLLPIMLILAGCASNGNLPDWRIGFSFGDEDSCGYYRSFQIFDDGHVDYTISHLPGSSKTLQIGRENVANLVRLVRTFPVELSHFGDRVAKSRGGNVELGVLRDELARVANIKWEDLSAHRQVCPQSSRSLPSGQIVLRDDF